MLFFPNWQMLPISHSQQFLVLCIEHPLSHKHGNLEFSGESVCQSLGLHFIQQLNILQRWNILSRRQCSRSPLNSQSLFKTGLM